MLKRWQGKNGLLRIVSTKDVVMNVHVVMRRNGRMKDVVMVADVVVCDEIWQ